MSKRMLIDAAHPEETRVVVLNGNRLEEFDFETSTKKQIKGNIYLAKVTRVEPSLQAAFVEYGGNRHGFLAFSEIHPDYYRIPVADRQAALAADRAAEQAANAREEEERENGQLPSFVVDDGGSYERGDHDYGAGDQPDESAEHHGGDDSHDHDHNHDHDGEPERMAHAAPAETLRAPEAEPDENDTAEPGETDTAEPSASHAPEPGHGGETAGPEISALPVSEMPVGAVFAGSAAEDQPSETGAESPESPAEESGHDIASETNGAAIGELPTVIEDEHDNSIETVGGDELEEATRPRARPFRHYKIQEVIKRRQIMLVQVTKEERGNKGAALTTYLSLAGRYCVLMPNTPRGGGVSRKITNNIDRRRLKDLMSDLDVPEGMGVIVRTAGSERSKTEIKRDFEYLLRLWDEIRELTLRSTAPALIYEEGNLIKRSIRDLYARDIEEVMVDGEEGYRHAKAFMKMLMPSHAKRVKAYRDPTVPLFHRFQVEAQIDLIHSPNVQLRSGGYIVINPTEALVAIDVNSGRSTKERNIEETALKTNIEAAEEVARQLRLRDLAGLIVIDFIDMEEHRNQLAVERRLKEAMRFDRARIQLGRISPFGLLELSRQRLRPSLVEASTQPCPHCGGSGNIRSTESTALHVLRAIEEEGTRRRTAEILLAVPSSVALYVLNQKRAALVQSETRYGFQVMVTSDDTLIPPAFRLDRVRALTPAELAALPAPVAPPPEPEDDDDIADEDEDGVVIVTETAAAEAEPAPPRERHERAEAGNEDDAPGRRRRRRRRRRPGEEGPDGQAAAAGDSAAAHEGAEHGDSAAEPAALQPGPGIGDDEDGDDEESGEPGAPQNGEVRAGEESEADRKRRRRGRRSGRRRRRGTPGEERAAAPGEEGGDVAPATPDGGDSEFAAAAEPAADAPPHAEDEAEESLPLTPASDGTPDWGRPARAWERPSWARPTWERASPESEGEAQQAPGEQPPAPEAATSETAAPEAATLEAAMPEAAVPETVIAEESAPERPEAETVELIPVEPPPEDPVVEIAEAFTESPAPRSASLGTEAVSVGDQDEMAETAADSAHPHAAYNVPPPVEVTGPPPKPRRGWWRR